MRLPNDARFRFLALGFTAMLAACGRGGNEITPLASAGTTPASAEKYGPAGDYPVILGDPYSIDGTLYTPSDALNHDEVGYAALDPQGGSGVTVAHKTLPLPSYVEITALKTGKTILARVERRGPNTNDSIVGLSQGARSQLEASDGDPVRVRRVNPPEEDRVKLRMGEAAPFRMETPKSLLAALTRNLPAKGSASLTAAKPNPSLAASSTTKLNASKMPMPQATPVPREPQPEAKAAAQSSFEQAFSEQRKVVKSYPLTPLDRTPAKSRTSAVTVSQVVNRGATEPAGQAPASSGEGLVIQAAAFSSKANAQRAAKSIDGFVEKSGKYYRVRKGPFANRGQAEAALAKVRAAGYRDARVFSIG